MASNGQMIDIRALEGARERLVCLDGGQFAVSCLARNGDLVVVARGGAGHLGIKGRLDVIRSSDQGETWSPPAVVVDSEWDDRNPAIGVSPSGAIALAYHQQGSYDEHGRYLAGDWASRTARFQLMSTTSSDNGLTWDQPTEIGVRPLTKCSPYGRIVTQADGTMLLGVCGMPEPDLIGTAGDELPDEVLCSYLLRSSDEGKSWHTPTFIGVGEEPALLGLLDGTLLAAIRGNAPSSGLSVRRSHDGGVTWTNAVPVTGDRQHPADLFELADGAIVLAYGNRTPPYRVEGVISTDGGHQWSRTRLAFSGHLYGYSGESPRPTDLGYPMTTMVGEPGRRRCVTTYYCNPDFREDGSQRAAAGGPFFQAQGYRATALLWDEAALISALAISSDLNGR